MFPLNAKGRPFSILVPLLSSSLQSCFVLGGCGPQLGNVCSSQSYNLILIPTQYYELMNCSWINNGDLYQEYSSYYKLRNGEDSVRNIFKILGCRERKTTQLRTQQTRQNLLLQKGVPQKKSKHTQQGVHWGFISNAMLPCPWIGQVLGSQSTWLANWKEEIGRWLWRQRSLKGQEAITVLGY
jgi:hypothetical protein